MTIRVLARLAVAVCALALAAPAASAQPAEPTPDLEALAGDLQLTRDQLARVRQLVDADRKQQVSLRADMELIEIDLRRELASESPDEAKVGTWVERLATLDGAVRKSRIQTWLRLRKTLTPRQRRKLEARGDTPVAVAPSSATPPPAAPTGVHLDRQAISAGIQAVRSRVAACSAKHVFTGVAKATMVIGASGQVSAVKVDAGDAASGAFASCVGSAIKSARFPRAEAPTTVTYPFVFK